MQLRAPNSELIRVVVILPRSFWSAQLLRARKVSQTAKPAAGPVQAKRRLTRSVKAMRQRPRSGTRRRLVKDMSL